MMLWVWLPDLDAQEKVDNYSQQFVVLKTGSVYSGQLEFGGGKYIIHRNNGSSVRFHQGEVDFVTHSLEAAYQQLRSRLDDDDVIGHQRLAQWCLKNRQVENSQTQLALLKRLPGGQKSLKLLERQIKEMANPKSEQTPVELAAYTEAVTEGVRRLPSTKPLLASRDDLKKSLDSYSRESLREFNRGVHQRIVNGCAAARCHGDAENSLRLWRVDNRGGLTSTGIQRNLHAISRYIDRNDPQQSTLLKYVSEVHGDMDAPAYDPTSHHYHAIRDWILGTAITGELSGQQPDELISQTGFLDRPQPASGKVMQGELIPAPVDLSVEEKRFVPRDEFDPQLFNREFGDRTARLVPAVVPKPLSNALTPSSPLTPSNPLTPKSKLVPASSTRALPPVNGSK
ncbi:MAG: hypothetical protein P8J91_12350 [Pirellulaceae bacterium]|nr:hypothetical protein [Pirellulaceae bacterium]